MEEIIIEKKLLRRTNHAIMAWDHRVYSNEMIRQVKKPKEENFHFYCRSYATTFKYAQNLGLLHFGNEKLSDMHYYYPLSLVIFGICNNSSIKDYSHVFLCHEKG